MKNTISFIALFIFSIATAQIGINTEDPKTTLDVVGVPTNAAIPDGIIAPRITLAQLNAKTSYGTAQNGAIVYVTNSSGVTVASTIQVSAVGYYYFNGTIWKSLDDRSGAVIFTASLGTGVGANTNATVAADAFLTVPLPAVSKNIGGGTWNATNNTFAIPTSGTYIIKSTVRLKDGSSSRNIFQAVATTNTDIADGVWDRNPTPVGTARWSMLYTRIAYFTKGDLLRLYIFSDGSSAPLSDASLNIALLGQN